MPDQYNKLKRNLGKELRIKRQTIKKNKNRLACQTIKDVESPFALVAQATEKRLQKLITAGEPADNKIKLVSAVRKGYMHKHGVMVMPSRINKKKVKKMLQRARLTKS